jgi:hypothetical protein
MTSVDGGLRARPLRWVVLGLCLMLALLLGVISLQRNLQRACELHEWPDFSSCPVPDEAVPAQVRDLRARIAANPGDSSAWLALALLAGQPGGVAPLDDAAVLAMAGRMAPQDPLLLRVQASRALQREQWALACQGWFGWCRSMTPGMRCSCWRRWWRARRPSPRCGLR